FTFVVGVGAHGSVGQQQGHAAGGGQVVDHVLHPGEVGVALGWGAVLPAHVIGQGLTPPVLHVERRVGHDKVGAQVRVLVVEEGVGVLLAEVEVDAADGHVHGRQLPGGGVGFLAVYGDVLLLFGGVVVLLLGVLFNELVAGDKEAAGTHGRVVHAAGVGLEHFHDQGDDALGGVVLATLLALGQRELAQEVFIDMAEDVLAVQVQLFAVEYGPGKGGVGEGVDQPQQLVVFQLVLADTVENPLQLYVALLDLFQSVVD